MADLATDALSGFASFTLGSALPTSTRLVTFGESGESDEGFWWADGVSSGPVVDETEIELELRWDIRDGVDCGEFCGSTGGC